MLTKPNLPTINQKQMTASRTRAKSLFVNVVLVFTNTVMILFLLEKQAFAKSTEIVNDSDAQYEVFKDQKLEHNKEDKNTKYKIYKTLIKEYADSPEELKLKEEEILIDKFDINSDGSDEIFIMEQNRLVCSRMYKDCPISIYDKNQKNIFNIKASGIKILKSKNHNYFDIQIYWVNVEGSDIYSWKKTSGYKFNFTNKHKINWYDK